MGFRIVMANDGSGQAYIVPPEGAEGDETARAEAAARAMMMMGGMVEDEGEEEGDEEGDEERSKRHRRENRH